MKRGGLIFAALLLAATARAQQASPSGLWRVPDEGGLVEVSPWDGGLCGRIVGGAPGAKTYDIHNEKPELRTRPLKAPLLFESLKGGPPE